jgi:hypothetical protein
MNNVEQTPKKIITACVYCPNPPDGQEHWLNRSLGTFRGNTLLTDRLCTPCNEQYGRTIDLEVARSGPSGVFKQVLGIEGRRGHQRKNVFEYKASQLEPPVQVFQVDGDDLKPLLHDAIGQAEDGSLISTEGRVLVIAMPDGEHRLRFPRGWGEAQLRAAVEARGLSGGRLVAAHVPAPETVVEFEAASTTVIRAVFGAFEINVYTTRTNDPAAPVVQTLLRFNLSPEFLRGVAKMAFHYFLWACPTLGGDEPEFANLKAFIRDGVGEPTDFIRKTDSLVDRIPTDDGSKGNNGHVFASLALDGQLIVQAHLFSLAIGPEFPTFLVRLGPRPEGFQADWQTAHVAAYRDGIAGHDGILRSFDDIE